MAQFDESKVINALHPEKAEIGKKYWFSDDLASLKEKVESNRNYGFGIFDGIDKDYPISPFEIKDIGTRQYLYPYEEPPKQRMTNRQFCEWYNRGNGQWKWKDSSQCHTDYSYSEEKDNDEVDKTIHIRPWDSEEWIEPTLEVYLKDCKGGTNDTETTLS